EGALREFDREPEEFQRIAGRPLALFALARRDEADGALQTLLDKGRIEPETIATVYAFRGEKDAAFEWLHKAAAELDPSVSTAITEPWLDSLHDDARWVPYLRSIGYAPDQLAKVRLEVVLPAEN